MVDLADVECRDNIRPGYYPDANADVLELEGFEVANLVSLQKLRDRQNIYIYLQGLHP